MGLFAVLMDVSNSTSGEEFITPVPPPDPCGGNRYQNFSLKGFEKVGVPVGVLAPDSFEVVATEEQWKRRIAGSLGQLLANLHPLFPDDRLVLMGPTQTPVSCGAVWIRACTSRVDLVIDPPAANTVADPGGCVFLLRLSEFRGEVHVDSYSSRQSAK